MDYSTVKLSEEDIRSQNYKRFLGGGVEHWERRGAFQLFFLKTMGLERRHRLLDAGCGPLRSGVQFIDYLDSGRYCGVDNNADFIRVGAELVAQNPALRDKTPRLERVDNFDFSQLTPGFDFVLAFSVLNHCPPPLCDTFFENVSGVTHGESKIYITHASWFQESVLKGIRLRLKRRFNSAHEIAAGLDLQEWGWPPTETIFPILELANSGS